MRNVNELRNALSVTFADLKAGKLKPNEASGFANIAGKMIQSAKVQVDYYAQRKIKKPIKFLEEP